MIDQGYCVVFAIYAHNVSSMCLEDKKLLYC
jgi:hypothetical protein